MAYDLEEQEQIDEFKAWWNKHGKMVTNLVIAGLIAYAGWQGYHVWANNKASEASTLYQKLVTMPLEKTTEINAEVSKLKENYSATPYAGRGAVLAAKSSYSVNKVDDAKQQLEWAIQNAKESSVKAIASYELAGIYFQNKEYDQASKVLNAMTDPGFSGLRDNMLGDILLVQHKDSEAKKAYESAMKNLDPQGKLFMLTKQKLESLG